MNLRRGMVLLLCLLAGCSTHPMADLCDLFKPAKLGPTTVTPYGGVAIPQGPIAPAATVGPGPLMPVVPGPAPVPGNRGPVEIFPPIPPSPPAKF